MIQFNCDGSLSTTTKWIIKNCTSTSCSFEIILNEKVMTTFSELYIPSRTLAYGVYQLTLTVTMIDSPSLKASSSVYVRITATGITANLVQLGTSMVTRGDQQDLLLDPGTFSVDPDEDTFDATKWKYTYYCRIYDLYNFPNIQGILLSIDDSRIDPYNPSCLSYRSGNGTGLIFGNLTSSPNSSLTVLGGSLQLNQIYQFMVYMENGKNSSIQATGYVLVTIEITHPQLIAVGMFISILNDGFHHVEETATEDQQMLSYMLKKFLNWTHLRRPNVEEIYELQDSRMRSQYADPIENFPDKIDQLLEAIDRIYIDQKKELLKLKRAGV
ncbi:unnamed protein product [Adineta steineri]|uniref:PKD/REJ-like domain-containing protein n=2 Tax=Adineta steineri TaxID=433720 RepID=A0A814V3V1_9BILA|nr:unnamed protein product [Adineta steineri]